MPMGSFISTSRRMTVRETMIITLPYRKPVRFVRPWFSTSQGATPIFAWIVR